MAKKKLGKKHACYQCGCKFYDLGRTKAVCPKCGADQKEAPTKEKPASPKTGASAAAPPRTRGRRRRTDEEPIEPAGAFSDDDVETESPLEDGLTMIDDEELLGPGAEDFSEED